jgi:hypothetical protein
VAAGGGGKAVDIERGGTDVDAGIEGRSVAMLGAVLHHEDGSDVGEARLAGVTAVQDDPIDLGQSGVGACLDEAMTLFHRGFADDFVLGCGVEISFHFGFEIGLIALAFQK